MPSLRLGSVVGVHSTYYYSHGVEVQQDVFSSGTFMTRRHEDLASAVLCSAAYCQAPQRVRTISTVSPNLFIKNKHEFEILLHQVNRRTSLKRILNYKHDSGNFGNFLDFLGNSSGTFWELFGISLGLLLELFGIFLGFFWSCSGILSEFFESSIGILQGFMVGGF